mmetsp:Transcript_111247/g.192993  ORF Transcript_111247/g.192993 Transcript_111247/m.192993 type:complete len:115 (-) Transcript_111247:346-690(-)
MVRGLSPMAPLTRAKVVEEHPPSPNRACCSPMYNEANNHKTPSSCGHLVRALHSQVGEPTKVGQQTSGSHISTKAFEKEEPDARPRRPNDAPRQAVHTMSWWEMQGTVNIMCTT